MAQYTYRANLSASAFPLLATNAGRTVIIPQMDNTYNRILANNRSDDTMRDVGIPQIYYCENVMPVEHGFQSIGYDQQVPASVTLSGFTSIYRIRSKTGVVSQLAVCAQGLAIRKPLQNTWELRYPFSGNKYVSVADVGGQSYICIANTEVLEWNSDTDTLAAVTLTGIVKTEIIGLISAGGYLVAYKKDYLSWSSTITPTDFTPSLTTGAGGGKVEGVKADIITAAQVLNGFIIYTAANAVAAILSGNARYPFVFREIVGAGGITDPQLVANDPVSGDQYAYTTAGMQKVVSTGATTVYPEITDFVAGRTLEAFDWATCAFTRTGITTPLQKKLTVVGNRYILLSYGITSLTEVLVIDIATRRLGKLKRTHVDCLDWNLAQGIDADTPKKSIGLMASDGKVSTVSFDSYAAAADSVIVLGKYQHVRSRGIEMQEVIVDNIYPGLTCEAKLISSLDGKRPDVVTLLKPEDTSTLSRKHNCRKFGINHSLALRGNFDLNSVVLTYTIAGDR